MNTAAATPKLVAAAAGEPTLFDSLARLVPEELQAAYYRVLAHTRTLSPDDEMLRILEAMGILALLTRHTPKDIADERERFQELFGRFDQSSNEAQQKMLAYVKDLESRLSRLPTEIEDALDLEQIARLLGESLRQHFLQSGMPDTVRALQTTSTTMVKAQQDLSSALRIVADSRHGVMAQVEEANHRLTFSLESRAKAIDELLRELKSDFLHIWAPLLCGASLLVGLFLGMSIQGWRDSPPAAATSATPAAVQSTPVPESDANEKSPGNTNKPRHGPSNTASPARHER